jgi:hypothetical protein
MAPTNAKATYAVTTLSLLTKVMETTSRFTSCPQLTFKASKAFPGKKVSFPVRCPYSTGGTGLESWLKTREIKALMSP